MTDKNYLLAIDQGTTGTTVIIYSLDAKAMSLGVLAKTTVDFPQHFPKPSWVEHDLGEIWASLAQACSQSVTAAESRDNNFKANKIACIGITNQRETLACYSRESGEALAKAIVWQCRRTSDMCQTLKKQGFERAVRKKTGLVLDPYFSGTKVTWLLKNQPGLKKSVADGKAIFSTIDAYVLFRLTAGKVFATEASNASRTMLFDINKCTYDSDLLKMLGLKNADCLPEIKDSFGVFGETKDLGFLPDGIPITAMLGDQQAALAGQTCFEVGEAKCTYGTGAFLLLNTGTKLHLSKHQLLTTVAWRVRGKTTYAMEGSCFIAGAAMQFLRDQLKFLSQAKDSELLANNVVAAPEIYFVPALSGLGAPYWNPKARGAFLGLTRGTTIPELVRASLESIAFEVMDVLEAMSKDVSRHIKVLRVDGGASANNLLMQMQANIANLNVDRPENVESTATGAALFAALGKGLVGGLKDLQKLRKTDKIFSPERQYVKQQRKLNIQGWQRAVKGVETFSRL